MAETAVFEAGGYRYVRGPFQYSGGVAAEPGFAIERVRFARPLLGSESPLNLNGETPSCVFI